MTSHSTTTNNTLKFTAPHERSEKQRADETKRAEIRNRLLGLLRDRQVICFRQPSGEPWVSLPRPDGGGYEHHRVGNHLTISWLMDRYTEAYGAVPDKRQAENALLTFAAQARASSDVREVYDRLAVLDESGERVLYLDLGDALHLVRLTAGRWEVIDAPPTIAFRRATGFEALPLPAPLQPGETPGGVLQQRLRPLLNCPPTPEGDFNFRCMVAWLIAAFYTVGDQAILMLAGVPGSGKSSVTETLRSLIDPNTTRHGNTVTTAEGVMFEAVRQYVPCFDNLRSISDAVSDALANVATGSGQAKRKLYTDDDIISLFAKRPIILNGLHNVVKRPDLVDRAFSLELPPLSERNRKFTKAQLREQFAADRPRILGAVLSVVASALARLPEVLAAHAASGAGHYRLGDFHMFVRAAEPALGWPTGTADCILQRQQAEKQRASMEQYADLEALRSLLFADLNVARHYGVRETDNGGVRTMMGAVGEVLNTLGTYAQERLGYDLRNDLVGWPKLPKKLAQHLREAEAALAADGIRLQFEMARHKTIVTITGSLIDSTTDATPVDGSQGSQPKSPSHGAGQNQSGLGSEGSEGSHDSHLLQENEKTEKEEKREEMANLPSPPSHHSPTPINSGLEPGSQRGGTETLPPTPPEATPGAADTPADDASEAMTDALANIRATARRHGGKVA